MKTQAVSRFVGLVSAFVFLSYCAPAFAAKIGPEFPVNSFPSGSQQGARVAGFSDGSFIVVWQSELQDSDMSRGIYARRYRADGTRRGPEFRVNTTIANSQESPDVAALGNDGFVVVWGSQDGSGGGVYGQRFRADFTRAGAQFKVNTHTANDQGNAVVAPLSGGGFVVIWQSTGQDGSERGVYGQRYSSAGARIGGEFRVNTTKAKSQENAAVAGLGNGGFVVAWCSDGQDGAGNGVFGQRYQADGTRAGGEFRVNTLTQDNQCNPAVASWGENGFVAVWDSLDGANSGGVRGQRFNAQGRAGPEFVVNTTRADFQGIAAVASLGNGGFIVCWDSYATGTDTADEADVYGQRYGADGARVGGEFRINSFRNGDQRACAVAALKVDGFVVVWQSFGQDGSSYGIFGQRYSD
jgi:hypothetical protein